MAAHRHDWLCREIVHEARDAIILADRDGIIRLWNPGAEAMFGYRADEALEFTIALLHDPDGTLLGPAAVIRDVTARWEEERALKKRLAALEAGTRDG